MVLELEESGTRGGTVSMWDKRVREGVLSSVEMYSVTRVFLGSVMISIGTLQGFIPQIIERRVKRLVGRLGQLEASFRTLHEPEKKNCNRISKGMINLSDFIEDMKPVDLALLGGVVHLEERRMGYKLQEHQTEYPTQKSHTSSLKIDGWKQRVSMKERKCGGTLSPLKEWSKTSQGNLGIQKHNALRQLTQLEEIQEHRALKEEETASILALNMEFGDIAKKGRDYMEKEIHDNMVKQEDRNTRFFTELQILTKDLTQLTS
ncbi:hypothetical protein H5410_042387 [Solanum commersonii]|uniref:Uncharacterized protein n=1 Tax=Solanum commersonii TaxID=4109 RepID=A0A9J5XUK9_SOLCO|nr:hypothetical protein H5410_042387 [Solanum commersonii]